MEIKWLKTALQNLNDEAEYIAQDNPTAAQLVVHRIVTAIKLLSDNPTLGRPGRIHGTRAIARPPQAPS